MDPRSGSVSALTLLVEAATAGLTIRLENSGLVVRGPRRAEAVARKLLDRKIEIIFLLAWNETRADRLRQQTMTRLGRLRPPRWQPQAEEEAELVASAEAIDRAFSGRDMLSLLRALHDYTFANFRSWRRWNQAGTPITREMLPSVIERLGGPGVVTTVRALGLETAHYGEAEPALDPLEIEPAELSGDEDCDDVFQWRG